MAAISKCIIWTGFIHPDGYGMIYREGKTFKAHRYLFEQSYGYIDKRLVLDHLCRNKACINLKHLEVVSIAENTRRGKSAKLNHQKVNEIKRLYGEGTNQLDIARAYKITQSQVSRVVNERRWA